MFQIFSSAELTVGHINKIISAQDFPQPFYIVSMDGIVRPVVLVDAVSDLRPAFRCLVLPLKSYRGVVVNPSGIQLKMLDDV